ncbi:hypothetical protein BC938DRAFT_472133 [Jimgerdemannia flammicorona]|uniref:Uncharacterized protein n=1 Tax=Jimgerdemannia flammicorona TaxID=994334 RepID=A0A433QU41_9FUNG|nr:hypothetical protein BC938DRAFT_472133 [Jimgerdemannia flammicorona]
MHRTLSVRQYLPFRNRVWMGAVFAWYVSPISVYRYIWFQYTLHSSSFFARSPCSQVPTPLNRYPGFVWPVIFLPVQELVKMHDNKEYTRFQKRSKLEFNTKLGMHSPL